MTERSRLASESAPPNFERTTDETNIDTALGNRDDMRARESGDHFRNAVRRARSPHNTTENAPAVLQTLRGWPTREGVDVTTVQVYLDRIAAKTGEQLADGCLPWIASMGGRSGHGVFRYEGKLTTAHRVVYMLHFGSLPDGQVVDHVCGRRECVNIEHLRAVSVQQNSEHRVAMMPNNTSGYPNVWYAKRWSKWQTSGNRNGVKVHLGYYESAWDAYCAWREWALVNAPFTNPRMLQLGPEDAKSGA